MPNKKSFSKKEVKSLRIGKDWTISDIFKRFPQHIDELSDVMTEYGLHCVGCNANQFETVEQGCEGHGFDEDIINSLVDDMNKVVSKKKESSKDEDDSIIVSKQALLMLSDILSRKSKELKKDVFLRINFNGASEDSCCQNLYSLGFEAKPSKNDVIVDTAKEGVKIVLNKDHLDNFSGISIDYANDGESKGFKITASMNNEGCACCK
ncbi:MAG: DUF1858 domain-containing protein [Nanoarchaeota archaeon]